MGKWYKKVVQSRMLNVDCIMATSRVKMVHFWHFFSFQNLSLLASDKHVYRFMTVTLHYDDNDDKDDMYG